MKLTVGKKIGAGFCMAIALTVIIGAVAYHSTLQFVETAGWVTHTEEVLRNLDDVISSLKDVESGQRGYAITGEESFLEPYHTGLGHIGGNVSAVRSLISDNDRQRRRLGTIEPLIAQRLATAREIIEARKGGTFEAAQKLILSGTGKQQMDEIRAVVTAMENEENALLKKRREETDDAAERAKLVIIFGGLAGVFLLVPAGYLITRNIARPLGEVTRAADKIADGDLNFVFKSAERDDEVGVLMEAFQRMTGSLSVFAGRAKQIADGDFTVQITPRSERDVLGNAFAEMTAGLRRIMRELLDAVNVLASAAGEIMSSTSQLAATAAQTATAVTETTATVEEVKQTSQISSQRAKSVALESEKAVEIARDGRRAVQQTVEGMSGIRRQMSAVAESILSLSEQSQAIGEIISSVDDLAAQSKLLAVNAAIEAAKAGEEGRGFSVVAQEVKSLADQSKQATMQVRGILNEIQKATSNVVMATEQGSKSVEAGVRQSNSAGESISQLADSISDAAEASTQIATTSKEQFVGMDQVALAMENIKRASLQTVTSTKQAETAAQRLHDIGQQLKQLVGRFKV